MQIEHIVTSAGGAERRRWSLKPRTIAARSVDIWLPPAAVQNQPVPVIYMHDGQNLFEPGYSYAGVPWAIDQAMERLIAAHGTPGAIIVGVWNNPDQRWREYGPQIAGLPIADAFLERAGGPPIANDYLRFLVEELKPQVDAALPTLPDQANTWIMGSSMGGLISLYALEQYPALFGAAACVSTHWPAGGDPLVDALAAALPPPGRHRLYFDYGSETLDAEYEPFQLRMDALLAAAGYRRGHDWVTQAFPGAEHSERSWAERAHIPLAFLLGLTYHEQ